MLKSANKMRLFGSVMGVLAVCLWLTACGDSGHQSQVFGDSLVGEWSLIRVGDQSVSDNDRATVQLVETKAQALSLQSDCSGKILVIISGSHLELLDNGLSVSGCFITIVQGSNQDLILRALEAGADFKISGDELQIGAEPFVLTRSH